MKLNSFLKRIFLFFLPLMYVFVMSCKDDTDNYIPYVPVDFTVDLNTFNDLTITSFSQKYDQPGFGGVIVFCEYYDVVNPFNSIYHAYDATCTFEITADCSLENKGNSVISTCPCCSSKYSLFDGYPIEGSASIPLKMYNVSLLNNKLYISNR